MNSMAAQHPGTNDAGEQAQPVLDDDFPELTCPGCGTDLAWDDLFLSHRVCSHCQRHFPLAPRDRLALIVDTGSFQETNEDVAAFAKEPGESSSAIIAPPAQRLAESRERDLINETVVTGTARIGGQPVVIVVLDEHATGTAIGSLTTEKVVRAMELAVARRLPLTMFVTGGNAPTTSGPLSLVQPNRIAAVGAQLHIAGVPALTVLCESASVELAGVLAGQCDVVMAEPDTRIWHDRTHPVPSGEPPLTSTQMQEHAWIDAVVQRDRLQSYLANVLDLIGRPGVARVPHGTPAGGIVHPAGRDALQAARRPDRPAAAWYVEQLVSSRVELRGDRGSGDTTAVRAGIGRLDGVSLVYAALDPSTAPAGTEVIVRKLIRMIGVATRLDLPLLLVIGGDDDTSEDLGSALMTAKLSGVLSMAPVPVVVAVTGEVRSGLARSLLTGDRLLCQVNAVFCLSGAQPGLGRIPGPGWQVVTSVEAQRLGLIDQVIPEPAESAASDPQAASVYLREAVGGALAGISASGSRRRVTERQQRIRSVGQSTPAGRDAMRAELNDLRELQRNIARSMEDWRERWDQLRGGQRTLALQRPDWTDMANRLRQRRADLLERASRIDRHLR